MSLKFIQTIPVKLPNSDIINLFALTDFNKETFEVTYKVNGETTESKLLIANDNAYAINGLLIPAILINSWLESNNILI